jgi:uncharacterized membrane protein
VIRDEVSLARVILAAAFAGLGGAMIATGNFIGVLQLVPSWLPVRAVIADMVGALFVIGAIGMVLPRHARGGARIILAVLAVAFVALDVPLVVTDLHAGNAWTLLGETLALGSGVAIVAMPEQARLARIGFAITLPVFAALHYFFHEYVASVIPSWIPAHETMAYATGAAMLAAGLAILTGIQARLAATLTAVMFGLWFAILHVPRLVDHAAAGEWASMCICLGMCGSAWLVRTKL